MTPSPFAPQPIEPSTTERIACYREKLVANAIVDLEDWSAGGEEAPRLRRLQGTPPLRDRASLRWSPRHARILGTGRPSEREPSEREPERNEAPRRGRTTRRPARRWQPSLREAADRG